MRVAIPVGRGGTSPRRVASAMATVLTVVAGLLVAAPAAYAESVDWNDGVFTFTYDDDSPTSPATFTGCFDGCPEEIEIPSSITGDDSGNHPVTTVGDDVYRAMSGVTSLTIPDSVTTIGYRAFYDMSGVTSLTIGNSVATIGDFAFHQMSGVTSLTIPDSVTTIGDQAFYHMSGVTSLTIGNSVTTIGNEAFLGMSGVTSLTIPDSVTTIGNQAFAAMYGVRAIEFTGLPLPTLGYDVFLENMSCTVSVPHGATWTPEDVTPCVLEVLKGDQTISFTNPGSKRLDESPVTLSATASSGLPVEFTTTTPSVCTVSGPSVTLVATGTCTINAEQAGDDEWNPAPQIQQSFTVSATPTPKPVVKKAQQLRPGAYPKRIKVRGITVLNKRNAKTRQGQPVKTKVTITSVRGETRCFRVIRGKQRELSIRTFGQCVFRANVTYTAPGNSRYFPLKVKKTIQVR